MRFPELLSWSTKLKCRTGAIATVYYNSNGIGALRRMHIYTPPDYEIGSSRLPVLYLLHGGGDSDDSWGTVGRAGAILDNLIAAGSAVPVIIVMPAGHVSTDFRLGPGVRMGHDAFNEDLTKSVLPFVDAHYRTIADRDHRALAGLSMGGIQTLTISLTDSADFGWIGVFSSGWFPNLLKEEEETDLAQYRASGKPFDSWVDAGKYDIALENSRATVALLNKAGIKMEEHESPGFHAWNNWRNYLYSFAQLLFRSYRMSWGESLKGTNEMIDKRVSKLLIAAAALFGAASVSYAQSAPVITGDARVDNLLSQMTLAEKIRLIDGTHEDPTVYQGQAGFILGVPRLGVPGLRFADGPPGVLTRHPAHAETATMGVAATFNRKTAEENGIVIGGQARSLGIDVALQPFVNIVRDLEFERAFNTFGEDSYLTAEMGVAEIRGIQSQHVMAQIKHYIGYDSEGPSTVIDDQTLHEVYVAPFEAAVKRADVSSVMCSYNRLNGIFACGNKTTLVKILRDEIGFSGFVTSDWGAVHAVDFINQGLDMEIPGEPAGGISASLPTFFDSKPVAPPPSPGSGGLADMMEGFFGHLPEEPKPAPADLGNMGVKLDPRKMPEALKDGLVTEDTITRAAGHVLYEIVHFGYMDGQQKHAVTAQSIEENAKVIQHTAEEAAVLLKNDGVLPLRAADLDSTVLIGPTARQVDSIGMSGERSTGLPERQVGPWTALKKITGNSKIQLAIADDMEGTPIPASLYSHDGKPGLVRDDAKVDPQINFTTKNGKALPANSRITWKGTLTVPADGEYWIYLQALGTNAGIKIDGKRAAHTGASQGGVHGDVQHAGQDNIMPTLDGLDNVRRSIELNAGAHAIEVAVDPDTSSAPVQMRLNWYTPEQRKTDYDAALDAAKKAKVAVVFAWTRLHPTFGLPGDQNKLIEAVASVNPNTIVVLNTSLPVALPWADKVKGILEMWWPGDEGGWATANLLAGRVSPAGRLPVTWAKALTDYPATNPKYPERSKTGVNGVTTYSDGIYVGYRWFDKENVGPLYAFGYGLSYTNFDYSGLKVEKTNDGGLKVMVTIKNTGAVDSDEVPQVYVSAPEPAPAGVQFAVRTLVGFDRVQIKAGESNTVTLDIAPRQLDYWSSKDGKWMSSSGKRTVSVGASSRDLRVEQVID